ncbi:MAG: DUF4062 domain-containing protein [Paludibacteraceae bacterium]|nr:DUF4062 domain-containing protein [Paludibacteraceae bacterium]
MEKERTRFIQNVMTPVRKEAYRNDICIKEIDFRWGISANSHVMKTCLHAIDKSKPYFIGILGNVYGSQPSMTDFISEAGYLDEYNPYLLDHVIREDPSSSLSYTHMEIDYAISHNLLNVHTTCFFVLRYQPNFEEKQLKLITGIKEQGYTVVDCHSIDEFEHSVYNFLMSLAKPAVEIHEDKDEPKYSFVRFNKRNTQAVQLKLYRDEQKAILNEVLDGTIHRSIEDKITFAIKVSHITSVVGEQGIGKTTTIARWASKQENIIYHFCKDGYLDDVFEHLYLELLNIGHLTVNDLLACTIAESENYPSAFTLLYAALEKVVIHSPIIIVLDGLEEAGLNFTFFVQELISNSSKNIHWVISHNQCPPNEDAFIINIPPLTQTDIYILTIEYLVSYGKDKSIATNMAEKLSKCECLSTPQILFSVLYFLRIFANYLKIGEMIEKFCEQTDPVNIYKTIVREIENYQPLLKDSKLLVWLSLTNHGLLEDDLMSILKLSKQDKYKWHQILSVLSPYVDWEADRLKISNDVMQRAILDLYSSSIISVRNDMIQYFTQYESSNNSSPDYRVDYVFDELPYLLKQHEDWSRLSAYLLQLDIFDYAESEEQKTDDFIAYWESFDFNLFRKYITLPNLKRTTKDYILLLTRLADFILFRANEIFEDIDQSELNSAQYDITEKIKNLLTDNVKAQFEPEDIAAVLRRIGVSCLNHRSVPEAKKYLLSAKEILSSALNKNWDSYKTNIKINQLLKQEENGLKDKDDLTPEMMTSLMRTSLLKRLNPYIDVLFEYMNCLSSKKQASLIYDEAMIWIDRLDSLESTKHVDISSRNLELIKSGFNYSLGQQLYSSDPQNALTLLNKAFKQKYDYLELLHLYDRENDYQCYRLMETYKLIEACQIELGLNHSVYENQNIYIEAIEKYNHGYLDNRHVCNCIYNYAAYYLNQASGLEDSDVIELLNNACIYYDKVITYISNLSDFEDLYTDLRIMMIRSLFFKMVCFARLDQEDECGKICNDLLSKEPLLTEEEKEENMIKYIIDTCQSMVQD